MNKITHQDDDLIIKSRYPKADENRTDLQKFIAKYQMSKFKVMKGKLEIRSVGNLTEATNKAAQLINDLGLRLEVVQSADMASYRAFEVREVL